MLDRVMNYIAANEGFKPKPYRCTAGKLTIGFGRNIEDNGISRGEAITLLSNDTMEAQLDLVKMFNGWSNFAPARQMALIDMRFQLGLTKFLGFKKMIAAIRKEDWFEAQKELIDSKYAQEDTPGRAQKNAMMLQDGRFIQGF